MKNVFFSLQQSLYNYPSANIMPLKSYFQHELCLKSVKCKYCKTNLGPRHIEALLYIYISIKALHVEFTTHQTSTDLSCTKLFLIGC